MPYGSLRTGFAGKARLSEAEIMPMNMWPGNISTVNNVGK
jgi:hypothetical protein